MTKNMPLTIQKDVTKTNCANAYKGNELFAFPVIKIQLQNYYKNLFYYHVVICNETISLINKENYYIKNYEQL